MRLLLTLCLTLFALSGCGKKPSFVDAPAVDAQGNRMTYKEIYGPDGKPDTTSHKDGQKPAKRDDPFPRVYPKPWL